VRTELLEKPLEVRKRDEKAKGSHSEELHFERRRRVSRSEDPEILRRDPTG